MNVKLDRNDKKDLDDLARAEGKDPGELLRELLHDAIQDRKRNGSILDDEDAIRRQQQALRELHDTLDALPAEGAEDHFSGRDHDQALYGKCS